MQEVLTQQTVRLGLRFKTVYSTDWRTELYKRLVKSGERARHFDQVFSIVAGMSRGPSERLIEGSWFICGHPQAPQCASCLWTVYSTA